MRNARLLTLSRTHARHGGDGNCAAWHMSDNGFLMRLWAIASKCTCFDRGNPARAPRSHIVRARCFQVGAALAQRLLPPHLNKKLFHRTLQQQGLQVFARAAPARFSDVATSQPVGVQKLYSSRHTMVSPRPSRPRDCMQES
mmetsp:Transcript_6456/g.18021  ORF Transcript_6456/g.18021 Transcript_6456/m.18021 type:complete len:142 (-) Transcript_6456:8-433(-)